MIRTPYLFAAAMVVGLGLGWLTATPPRDDDTRAGPSASAFDVQHDGARAAAARDRLRALGLGQVYAPASETPAAPPPPDVAILFRRDLTAVEQTPRGPIVWVVDLNQTHGRRAIRVGGVYQDGWRVSAIRPQAIELRRRRERRDIAVFDPPAADQP